VNNPSVSCPMFILAIPTTDGMFGRSIHRSYDEAFECGLALGYDPNIFEWQG
jgi:hypothetical protein